MKAAFFYSEKQCKVRKSSDLYSRRIDGKLFTEVVSLEDDEHILPYGLWDDYELIAVVYDVIPNSYSGGANFAKGPLQNRITINGKIQ